MTNDILIGITLGIAIGTYIATLFYTHDINKRLRAIETVIARAKLVRWVNVEEELQNGK